MYRYTTTNYIYIVCITGLIKYHIQFEEIQNYTALNDILIAYNLSLKLLNPFKLSIEE